jgi:spore germination protein GerM
MKAYLLIDMDIWKPLVSKGPEFNKHLRELDYWVTHREVTLLVPDVLISEWKKHRDIEKDNIESALKNLKDEARLRKIFKDFSTESIQQNIDATRQILRSQLDTIDSLLEQKGLKIQTPDSVHAMISSQRKAEKKPFWNRKKDHTNDAELIFSTLYFLKENNHGEFYFISGNKNEFAKMPEQVLHPEIAALFPDVVCHYYTDFSNIYEPFDNLKISRRITDFDRKSGKVQNTIYVDKNKPILEQVHDYLLNRFEKLNFIPKELFAIHYPFAISDTFPYPDKPFTLITDNTEVFDLLTKLKIQDDVIIEGANEYIKSESDEIKVKAIFQCLLNNLIESIAFKDKDEVPLAFSQLQRTCSCSKCIYKSLNFSELLNREREPGTDAERIFCKSD